MRASGVVIVSAAALLASVPMCSSLRGSESGRGRSTHVLSAFVPPASRPALAALRFANVMCPRRQHSAEVGRALGGDAGMARFGRSLRGAVASARPARTCVLGVGGGFMEDPDAWGDDDLWEEGSGDGENDWRTVLLKDSKLDRTIECFVDREIEVEGKAYATLMPADTPVIMAGYNTVNGTQQLVPILDDKRIDELFATAAAVLSEMDLCLSRSAVVLTVEEVNSGSMSVEDSEDDDDDDDLDEDKKFMVVGVGPDGESSVTFSLMDDDEDDSDDYDDDDVLSLGTSTYGPIGLRMNELIDREAGETDAILRPGRGGKDEEEGSDEKVQVLATFYYEGEKYVVATPLEPVLIIGSPVVKGAERMSELRVGSDLDILSSLPGGSGLLSEKQDADESNSADYLLPDREELERVTPKIEQELETIWDVEEKERKVLVRLRQQLINQWGRTE